MVQQRARLYSYWLPPIFWAAAIFAGSTDVLSANNTGTWLAFLVNVILGHPLPPPQFEALHYAVRKGGTSSSTSSSVCCFFAPFARTGAAGR